MSHKKGKKVAKKVKEPQPKSMNELYPVRSLFQVEADQFKALTTLSNNRAAILKDIMDKEAGVKQMRELSKKIKKGDIKGPFLQPILPNILAPFTDTKTVAMKIDEQIKMVQTTVDIAKGQIPHRYEEYVDSLINFRDRLSEIIGSAKRSNIAAQRLGADTEKEKIIFEKSFDDYQKKIATKKKTTKCSCKSCQNKC
jgi:hypothetical protein